MINIDNKHSIKITKNKNNSPINKNITLKIYNKSNVLNGSWKWLNDKKITALMDKGYKKNTYDDQLDYFNNIIRSKKDILFAIYFKDKHIGNVGLHKINFKNKTAQFGILIGDRKYQNKGIGKVVWYEVINFAFKKLNFKKIFTMIVTKNIPSIKIAKKLGFIKMKKKIFLIKNNKKFNYPKFFLTKNNFKEID